MFHEIKSIYPQNHNIWNDRVHQVLLNVLYFLGYKYVPG